MEWRHWLTILVYAMMCIVPTAVASGGSGLQGGAETTASVWGGMETSRVIAGSAMWSDSVLLPWAVEPAEFEFVLDRKTAVDTVRSCDELASLLHALSLPDDARPSVEALADAMLTAYTLVVNAPPTVVALEARLGDLVEALDGLGEALLSLLPEAMSAASAGGLRSAVVLCEKLRDLLDGLRYLAGRLRLYSRGDVREQGGMLLHGAAEACCAGQLRDTLEALRRLRSALVAAGAEALQRSRREAAIAKVDVLLGDWVACEGSAECRGVAAFDLYGVSIESSGEVGREWGTRPTEASTEVAWDAAVDGSVGGLTVRGSVAGQDLWHDDASAAGGDARRLNLEVGVDPVMGEIEASMAVAVERTAYPMKFDRAVPLADVAATECGIEDLKGEVGNLKLAAPVVGRLLLPLDRSIQALRDGRREDAVTALGQFRDQVWKEAYSGAVGGTDAGMLAARADDLTPRRQESAWSVPFSLSAPLGNWQVDLDAEWMERAAPADDAWQRTDTRMAFSAERLVGGGGVTVGAQRLRMDYPNDPAKGHCGTEASLGVASATGASPRMSAEARWSADTYPLDLDKDTRQAEWSLRMTVSRPAWEIALEASETVTEHPGDRSRDTRALEWDATVRRELPQGDLALAWHSERQTTVAHWSGKEAASVELHAEWECTDVQLSMRAARSTSQADALAARWELALEAVVAITF